MGKLSNLFKYKKQVDIVDPETEKVVQKVWVRILGNEDLQKAFQYARIASSEKRRQLKDVTSDEYRDEIAQLEDVPKESLMSIIIAAQQSAYENEAPVVVVREDLPKIEEIAVQPDAPTLEDQEKLDAQIAEQEEAYKKALQEYVDSRVEGLAIELEEMPHDDLVKRAKVDLANIQALDVFVEELNDQRAYRGTFDDETCKIRSFDSIQDFKDAHSYVKTQVISAYNEIEMGSDDLKN